MGKLRVNIKHLSLKENIN